jgi:hypothetical protein
MDQIFCIRQIVEVVNIWLIIPPTQNDLKQGDDLSPFLLNFALEYVIIACEIWVSLVYV